MLSPLTAFVGKTQEPRTRKDGILLSFSLVLIIPFPVNSILSPHLTHTDEEHVHPSVIFFIPPTVSILFVLHVHLRSICVTSQDKNLNKTRESNTF